MDISGPVNITADIWWVGAVDYTTPFKCNAYLIDDREEAILIDPGPITAYESILQKVVKVTPLAKIKHVILSHQDPDVCGAMPAWERELISTPATIVTHSRNSVFINNYGLTLPQYLIDKEGWSLRLSSGRELRFIFTPWCHSPVSFMTYDVESRSLFSGDIFGAITWQWNLFADEYYAQAMQAFHDDYMASSHHLQYALSKLSTIPIDRILPQHGSIIDRDPGRYINILLENRCGIDILSRLGTDESMTPEHIPTEDRLFDTGKRPKGFHNAYRYIINRIIEREEGILGKDAAIQVAQEIEGIFLDSHGNLLGIYEKDGRDILNRLLERYEERFGLWAVLSCRLMLNELMQEFGLEVPKFYREGGY